MEHTIIIAEAGVNHNGQYGLAEQLIQQAHSAGADYVKFQTAVPECVISKFAEKAEYQKQETDASESQLEMCRKLHLPLSAYKSLKEKCDQVGIRFISTPFDLPSIDLLADLHMDFFKIPSGEITNLPYLRKIARLHVPVVISTGMCRLGEIEEALLVFEKEGIGKEMITLLHCNTEYPTPYEDVNLKAMHTLKECFGTKVGYSDHTQGIEIPIAAVAMGASIIEKHFTLDKNLPGPDHKASLIPSELKAMVQSIRHIEQAIGDGIKKASPSETKNMDIARKSIIASKDIRKGEIFSETNLTTKRPGNGISPMSWDHVIGKRAPRDFKEDELITLEN